MEDSNIIDYVKWRGDLEFKDSAFNEIDGLILTQLAYIPFEGVVPSKRSTRMITLQRAAEKYFLLHENQTSLGFLIPKQIIELFRLCAQSARFGKLLLGSYVNKVEDEGELQFSAITAISEETGEMYVAFRGTDDTIVGWKEDFNMSFMDTVPAQLEAVSYFDAVVDKYVRKQEGIRNIYLGGHSKGGNLAVYAAAYVKSLVRNDREGKYAPMNKYEIQNKICAIHNFDGPGFGEMVLQSKEYDRIKDRIITILPQGSIIGMLLGHQEEYRVVQSKQIGLMQHDAFTWGVLGKEFVRMDSISSSSEVLDKTVKEWIGGMEAEESEKFFGTIFDILSASDAKTLTEFMNGKNKSLMAAIKAYAGEDEENKKMLREVIRSVYNSWRKNAKKPKDSAN